MKPTGVNLNDILYLNPGTVVKMPGAVCFDTDVEVKTIGNEVRMKPHGQNFINGFVLKLDRLGK